MTGAEHLADEVLAALKPKLTTELLRAAKELSADPLLSITQAARELGVSRATMQRLYDSGAFKRVPGLREVRIRRSTLSAYGK